MKWDRIFRSLVWLTLVIFVVTTHGSVSMVHAEPTGANFSIEPSTKNVQEGEVFTVNIKVDASSQPVDGAQTHVNFNPSYLRVVDASGNETNQIINGELYGAVWPDILVNTANNSIGQIDYAAGKGLSGSSANTSFILATIKFKVIIQTGGTLTGIIFNISAPRVTKAAYGLNTVTGNISGGTVIIAASVPPDTTPPADREIAPPVKKEEEAPPTAEDIEGMTTKEANKIIEKLPTEKAADILEEVGSEEVAAILEGPTSEKLSDTIIAMSETSLTDTVSQKPINWWLTGGIIAGITVISAVVFLVIRQKNLRRAAL